MALPEIKIQADFTEKPLAGKQRASDNASLLDVAIHGGVGGFLAPSEYDHITLAYTGTLLTSVVFRLGGAGGTVVATLVLGYDGSDNLITVSKS